MLSLLERPCCVHTNAIALKWSRLSPDGPNLLLYMHQDSICCSTLLRHGCHLYCRFLVVANLELTYDNDCPKPWKEPVYHLIIHKNVSGCICFVVCNIYQKPRWCLVTIWLTSRQ